MRLNKVVAVVVSFNGGEKTLNTIQALLPQVDYLHVVDNGSATASLALLERLDDARITVELLSENRGIGYALNRGVAQARARGCAWLLTMDQDSVANGDMVDCLLRASAADPRALCLSPNLRIHGEQQGALKSGQVKYAITSGNLVSMAIFDAVGHYNEDYFIDCVDFDFSLRVRKAGFQIIKVADAVLYHELGEENHLPAVFKKYYTLHSPLRRYYMFRNFLYLAKNHVWTDLKFISKLFISHLILFSLLIFYDPKPSASLRMIFQGCLDFISRKAGAFNSGTK